MALRITKQQARKGAAVPARPRALKKSTPDLPPFMYLLMRAVERLGTQAYTYRIRQFLVEDWGAECDVAQVYVTAKRLEENGHLKGAQVPAPEEGGHEVRVYSITPKGRAALVSAGKVYGMLAMLAPKKEGVP